MGIGLSVLELYGNLLRDGYFKNSKSIIELGSQDVVEWEQEKIGTKLEEMADYKYQKGTALTSEILHKSLGLERYECIDPDGRNNSLCFDLNKNLVETYGYTNQFDLVTNYGDTEHIFDQFISFLNIHNLCAKGGLMIHDVPFYGYLNHGFYNYNPSFFFNLASANNYRVIGIYIVAGYSLIPYRSDTLDDFSFPPNIKESGLTLRVVLQKLSGQPISTPNKLIKKLINWLEELATDKSTKDSQFRVPFDGRYLEGSKLQDNYAYQLNSNEHIKFVSQFHSEEYVKLAKIYEGSGQLEQAGEAYGTAAYFATRLAHILQTEGQTQEAAYYYGKAEELNACKPNQ